MKATIQGVLVLFCVLGLAAELPPIHLEGPEEVGPVIEQIREIPSESLVLVDRLIGAPDSSTPIEVLIVPEGSALAARTPEWVSGYAIGEISRIVLFPARARQYPDDGIPALLRHELAHILIHRASGGAPLPRWFHEGLALTAGGQWDLEDRSRMTAAMLTSGDLSLQQVEMGFHGTEAEIQRSYVVSVAFVRHILNRYGADTPRELLGEVARGRSFEEAFLTATGRSLPLVEREFWSSRRVWNRWIPVLTSSVVLWALITMLALWAIRHRRRRAAAIRQMWELEEELAELRRIDPSHISRVDDVVH